MQPLLILDNKADKGTQPIPAILTLLSVLALTTFACAALTLPPLSTATPTAPGQVGAIEVGTAVGTPGLKGNKKDYNIWTGTITSQTSRQYMSNGSIVNTCTTDWDTDLDFAVDSAGDVYGTGDAMLGAPRNCSPHSNLVENTAEMTISIQGLKNSTAFSLNLVPTTIKPFPSADFGGYMLLFNNQTCPSEKQIIQVPLTGDSTAETQFDLSATLTGCGGSADDTMINKSLVKLRFRFKCSDIPADMNDPTLKQLCQ